MRSCPGIENGKRRREIRKWKMEIGRYGMTVFSAIL
jgi:hypothetical protein